MAVNVSWIFGACKSTNENDTSDLKFYEINTKDTSSNKEISMTKYELGGPLPDSYGRRNFVLCVFLAPAFSPTGCINPFKKNLGDGTFEDLNFSKTELEFLEKAAKLLSMYPVDDESRLEKGIADDDSLDSGDAELIYELRHVHRRMVKAHHGLTLNDILSMEYGKRSYLVDLHKANSKLKSLLEHLRQFLAKVAKVDPKSLDYCYPVVAEVESITSDSIKYKKPKIFSRCLLNGFQEVHDEFVGTLRP